MKQWLVVIGLAALSGATLADVYVRGHVRADGTYVPPHYRSSPDNSTSNNWSSIGNMNPYTGSMGGQSSRSLRNQINPYDDGYYYGQ